MAKSSTKKRAGDLAADELLQTRNLLARAESNTRKKARTSASELDNNARHSSRMNKGSGGQITQLQNIERVQTQTVARVTRMDTATANKPVNPMAPFSDERPPIVDGNQRLHSKGAGVEVPSTVQSYNRPLSRASVPSSRYGFHLTPASSDPSGCASNFVSPASCDTSTVPPSIAPTSAERNISVALMSRSGSPSAPLILGRRGVSISRTSSTAPISRRSSAAPVSQISRRSASPVPLRTSQIARRAHQAQAQALNFVSHPRGLLSGPHGRPAGEGVDGELDDDHRDLTFPTTTLGVSYETHDVDVDEISPDEDKRAAEAALRGPGSSLGVSGCHSIGSRTAGGEQHPSPSARPAARHYRHFQDAQEPTEDDAGASDSQIDPVLLAISREQSTEQSGEDVVHAYHRRNGFPRTPAPERLRTIHTQQRSSTGTSIQSPTSIAPQVPQQVLSTDGSPTGPTIPDGELTGSVTKLRSYPHKFREVIERAKLIAQCDSATKDPFLPRPTFLDVSSGEFFNEALQECRNVPPGYWPNYRRQLGVLLWESLMTWRSTIKAKAREILPRFYGIGNHVLDTENQTRSRELIKGAAFLRHGVDSEGSTNNMAHPGLENLITEFFYSPSSLGAVFPEVFSREVPRVTVCLAATALHAALDKYVQTGTRQDRQFEYVIYSKVFTGFLDMQDQIDQDVKHALKTKKLRVEWASASRAALQLQPAITFSDEFAVILD